MSPDAIRDFLAKEYPNLVAERRSNPDGWAFLLNEVRRGADASRILRATRSSAHATTMLKLAVSSRLGEERELEFTGDEEQLRRLVDEELRLYQQHFGVQV